MAMPKAPVRGHLANIVNVCRSTPRRISFIRKPPYGRIWVSPSINGLMPRMPVQVKPTCYHIMRPTIGYSVLPGHACPDMAAFGSSKKQAHSPHPRRPQTPGGVETTTGIDMPGEWIGWKGNTGIPSAASKGGSFSSIRGTQSWARAAGVIGSYNVNTDVGMATIIV